MRFASFLPVAVATLIFGVASAADSAWDVPPTCAVSLTISQGSSRCDSPASFPCATRDKRGDQELIRASPPPNR